MEDIIRVTELDKFFGRLQVLNKINLEVKTREVVCIIGRSGSGKSTFLRCLNFLEEPSSGMIGVDDLAVKAGGKSKEHHQFGHSVRLTTGMGCPEITPITPLVVVGTCVR